MTLFHELMDASAARFAANVALRYRDRDCSYEQLRERTVRLACGLKAAGVERGDRIVLYLQNRPEVIEVAIACSRLGAVFVPTNPMLKGRQLAYVLRDSGARMLIASGAVVATAPELVRACPALKSIVVCDGSRGAADGTIEYRSYDELLAAQTTAPPVVAIDRDPAAILYTSGSTGRPKGVVVSHRNLVSGAHCVAAYLGNTQADRLLAALPLSFDYGFSQVSTALSVGACAVITNFSMPAALIKEVSAERITGLAGVPTMWVQLASNEWPQDAARSLRYITNSGGAFTQATIRKLQSRLPGCRIFSMYGLTEAFRSTYLDPLQLGLRPGSIGKAIPNQEILVLRPDGTRCGPGEIGELVHRGSLVSLGYWNDRERTSQRFRPVPQLLDGLVCEELAVWSGDLARCDEDGYLYFEGRTDDLIKSSGHRVSPSEVEEIVAEVAGVLEVVALGIPDPVLGQRVVTVIVAEPQAQAELVDRVRQHCRMQMPPYMVPAEVHILDALPRTENGKYNRQAVRRLLMQQDENTPNGN